MDSRQGEEAVHEAYASLPPRSAVMLGTWRVGCDGEYLMQRSLIEMVQSNPRIPVFSITRTCIGDVAIGGYVPEYESGAPLIATQIKKYYDTGRIDDVHFLPVRMSTSSIRASSKSGRSPNTPFRRAASWRIR